MKRVKGKFTKGIHYSVKTEFKKGQHWREEKPFWKKDWLQKEYEIKGRTALHIAQQFNLTENSILFWLRKHKIPTRTMNEIRKRKYWGLSRERNGMFGRKGDKNPNWKGGITQERQSFYSSLEWKECIKKVYKKFNGVCAKCGHKKTKENKLCIHHKVSFKYPDLRKELNNLILLCEQCHHFVHSKANINNEFLITYEQYKSKQ